MGHSQDMMIKTHFKCLKLQLAPCPFQLSVSDANRHLESTYCASSPELGPVTPRPGLSPLGIWLVRPEVGHDQCKGREREVRVHLGPLQVVSACAAGAEARAAGGLHRRTLALSTPLPTGFSVNNPTSPEADTVMAPQSTGPHGRESPTAREAMMGRGRGRWLQSPHLSGSACQRGCPRGPGAGCLAESS